MEPGADHDEQALSALHQHARGRRLRPGALRRLHWTEPSARELAKLGQALGLDYGVVRQLQNPSLAAGAVAVDKLLIVRFNVPSYAPDRPLEWKRVDAILARRLAVTLSAPGTDLVPRAEERWSEDDRPRQPGTLLACMAAEVLDSFEATLERFHSHYDHLTSTGRAGEPMGPGESLDRLSTQIVELNEELMRLCGLLDRFETWRPRPITGSERAELVGVRDRALGIHSEVEELRRNVHQLEEEVSGSEGVLDVESPRIVEIAATVGEHRIYQMTPAHAISGVIGGLAVSFGSLTMALTAGPVFSTWGAERAHLFASFLFPIGFLILVIGRGELFTENFFVPVTSVWMGRAKIPQLLGLWGTTLVFNLAGAVISAWVVTRHGVLAEGAQAFLRHLAEQKGHTPHLPMFFLSILAGWCVTLMTWLILATKGQGPRMVMVWSMGFLISAGHFSHVVVAAAEIFMGMFLGAHVTVGEWLWNNFFISTFGNFLGGIVFVTIAGYLQAHAIKAGKGRQLEATRGPRPPKLPARRIQPG